MKFVGGVAKVQSKKLHRSTQGKTGAADNNTQRQHHDHGQTRRSSRIADTRGPKKKSDRIEKKSDARSLAQKKREDA